ncbi:MAG TPA: hypothetical protein VFH38_01505 [Jatrophihabitans sp.]|nr:hypothetical protein [Jatrophihabitans sp.]
MMRRAGALGCAMLAATAALGAAGDVAAAGAASGYHYSHVFVRRSGSPCRDVFLDGADERGDTLAGTVYCGSTRAFLRSGRQARLLSLPRRAGRNTEAGGVADDGTSVLLSFTPTSGRYASYLRTPAGGLRRLPDPRAGEGGTVATDVNVHGEVVGYYYVAGSGSPTRGFVFDGTRARDLRLPGRHASSVQVLAVNNHGDLAGTYTTRTGRLHGFVVVRGSLHVVDAPGAGSRAGDGTEVTSIDDRRDYAGAVFFGGPGNDDNPFVTHSRGFVHRHGRFQRIAVPRSWGSNTMVTSVSDTGSVVGSYIALTGQGWAWRGFTADR